MTLRLTRVVATFGTTIPTVAFGNVRIGFELEGTIDPTDETPIEEHIETLFQHVRDATQERALEVVVRRKMADEHVFLSLPADLQEKIIAAKKQQKG